MSARFQPAKRKWIGIFGILLSIVFSAHAAPPVLKPAQTYQEVLNGKEQTSAVRAYKVSTAKILIADYDLIQKDFPQTRSMTHAQIDQWLLNQSGYLSKGQIDKGLKAGVNSPIIYNLEDHVDALRPPQYDRALVFQAEGGGLLDGKGFGANLPRLDTHANGLMETYNSVREYLYTKATREIFAHADAPFNVVDSYAVIDWGFDVHEYGPGAKSHRAGAILRQSHVRDLTDDLTAQGQISRGKTEEVERVIRRYGMTSGQKRGFETGDIETLNIQGTKDERFIYDYGHFRVRSKFERPGYLLTDYAIRYDEMKKNPKAWMVLDPKSPNFPQPDDRLKLSEVQWDEERITQKIKSITESLGKGKNLDQVRSELDAMVKTYVTEPSAQWKNIANANVQIHGCAHLLKDLVPN